MDVLESGAREVVATLRSAGFTALWAGGCVRDKVMGHAPKDYDIATDAKPEEVEALFAHTVGVGAQFGVMLVVLSGERHYEVATFRAEGSYKDGRRPEEVRWANAYEDVVRRDFTINGLLYDPEREELIDYVDGLADIQAGILRAIGNPHARFDEDKLRLLRAVRFASRLGFEVEPGTRDAIVSHAKGIAVVSAERVAAEYDRILTDGGAVAGLDLLADLGLLEPTLPELAQGSLLRAACARFATIELPGGAQTSIAAWTALLLDLEPPMRASVTLRMRMSRADQRDISQSAAIVIGLKDYDGMTVATRKRLLRQPQVAAAMSVAAATAAAGQLDAESFAKATTDLQRWEHGDLHPPRWVDGATLKTLGARPGPAFKDILDTIERRQLEGEVCSETDAIALATELVARTHSPERPH